MEEKLLATIVEQWEAVVASVDELGPIRQTAEKLKAGFAYHLGEGKDKLQGVKSAVEWVKENRNSFLDLIELPKARFDDEGLKLICLLKCIPAHERQEARQLFVDVHADRGRAPELSWYASRADWLSLEEKAPERLLSGLISRALSLPESDDYRDVMCELAPAHVCARDLGCKPEDLFEEAATFAGAGVADTFRKFGKQTAFGLSAFAWSKVETPHGVRFRVRGP